MTKRKSDGPPCAECGKPCPDAIGFQKGDICPECVELHLQIAELDEQWAQDRRLDAMLRKRP